MKPVRLHVRAIIRDGTRAFVGSQSLRKEELDSRREVGSARHQPDGHPQTDADVRDRLGRVGAERGEGIEGIEDGEGRENGEGPKESAVA